MGLTQEIGRFVAGMSAARVPQAATAIVKTGFTDCIAVMIAGWREPVVGIVAGAGKLPADPFAPSLLRLPSADRALVYGVAAHVLDFDDTALSGHPSAVLVPAILAEAQELAADGNAMIAAYVAGYEVWAELIGRESDPLHRKGWHPSAVLGPVASAAASSALRRLDAAAAAHAVGIAASLAGGVVANFGSMSKSLQVARAAQSGIIAARLAESGMTASPDVIEHDTGFLQAISPRGAVDRQRPATLGRRWAILESGLNVKLYPMCYCTHRILDGLIDLRSSHGLRAAEVASVAVDIGETEAAILRNHRPQTALDAKFSAEFAAAAALITGACGPAEVSDAFVARNDVQEIFPKVQIRRHVDKLAEDPASGAADQVAVTLRDGRRIESEPIVYPRGHFKRPVDSETLWHKFSQCTEAMMQPVAARSLFERLQSLDRLAAALDLTAAPEARTAAA